MGDTIRDPFDDDVDSDDDDIGKPRTPEIHHGGDDEGSVSSPDAPGFSDISDNEGRDAKEEAAAEDSGDNEDNLREDAPVEEEIDVRTDIGNDDEEIENKQGSGSPSSDHDANAPVSPISEEPDETTKQTDISKEEESPSQTAQVEKETTLESEEEGLAIEEGTSESNVEEVKEKDNSHSAAEIAPGELTEKESEEKSVENAFDVENTAESSRRRRISSGAGTDDDLEMPISPLGIGLSGPESEIVDDILKGDVSKLLPDIREESDRIPTVQSDDDDEEISQDSEERAPPKAEPTEQDEEGSETGEAGEQLIADIFGASDEEEEFEGFGQEDIEVTKKKKGARDKRLDSTTSADEEQEKSPNKEAPMTVPKPKPEKPKDDESEDSDDEFDDKQVFVSDFDMMIQKKKEINRTFRRKRKNIDIISDSDDLIAHMIKQMKEVVEEDRILNGAKQAATKKLKMLPSVLKHLNKADLQMTFLDLGVLSVLKDWLSPLPDGSLPHLQIREGLLKVLVEFPSMDTGSLKLSGLGKAVMYLYRHPKETRHNKEIAGKLINDWARPIFGVTSNFKSLSREEREERDYQNMSKKRRLSSADSDGGRTPKSIDSALQSEKKPVRPGDKGFVMRARVPMPSNKDYVVRPQNNIDRMEFNRKPQKTMNRFEKQKRKFDEKKKLQNRGSQRAVDISIEGRKMQL